MKTGAIVFTSLLIITPLISTAAYADDEEKAPQLRERITCFPAENIIKFVSKFQDLDEDKRDTVDMLFAATFEVKDDGALPERVFIRDNGAEDNFTLDADGNVPDFVKISAASETAEFCTDDPSREGTPRGKGITFSLNNDVHFLENTGYHDIATLEEGLKDGKTHYKKMVPGPMRMLVPKLTYVMIEYDAEETVPQYSAMNGQEPVEGLTHEIFCKTAMIKVEDIEDLGGDGLKVMGGSYNLTPVPKPKTLAKFVSCSNDEGENEDGEASEE